MTSSKIQSQVSAGNDPHTDSASVDAKENLINNGDSTNVADTTRGRKKRQQKQPLTSSSSVSSSLSSLTSSSRRAKQELNDEEINPLVEDNSSTKQPTSAQKSSSSLSYGATNGSANPNGNLIKRQSSLNEEDEDAFIESLNGQDEDATSDDKREIDASTTGYFGGELVWRNIILFVILHSSIPAGVYLLYNGMFQWRTMPWVLFTAYISALGVTGGAHRLWSHRAYKAHWSVHVLLMALQTMAGQNSIYTWCRDHRVHHKFSETDADPHNIHRGFFFAHMGWLCVRKHPAVKSKGALIDMSDLEANKVVMFQHRNFWWLSALFTVLLPTIVPVYLWNERFWTSFTFSFMIRYMFVLHSTWLVNSAAHYVGRRPYDKRIEARESPYAIWSGLGEGFHNYHHTFPFDYAASEYGRFWNITTSFIDLCARLGLVYDRRRVDEKSIESRRNKTGEVGWSHWQSGVGKGINQSDRDKQDIQEGVANGGSSGPQNGASSARSSANGSGSALSPTLNNIIHELPYISGLTSLQFTM